MIIKKNEIISSILTHVGNTKLSELWNQFLKE